MTLLLLKYTTPTTQRKPNPPPLPSDLTASLERSFFREAAYLAAFVFIGLSAHLVRPLNSSGVKEIGRPREVWMFC